MGLVLWRTYICRYYQKNLIDIKEDGTFSLNMSYFSYATGLTMTNKNFDKLFEDLPGRAIQILLNVR